MATKQPTKGSNHQPSQRLYKPVKGRKTKKSTEQYKRYAGIFKKLKVGLRSALALFSIESSKDTQ